MAIALYYWSQKEKHRNLWVTANRFIGQGLVFVGFNWESLPLVFLTQNWYSKPFVSSDIIRSLFQLFFPNKRRKRLLCIDRLLFHWHKNILLYRLNQQVQQTTCHKINFIGPANENQTNKLFSQFPNTPNSLHGSFLLMLKNCFLNFLSNYPELIHR